VNGGKKGKSQRIECSANANDVGVWMRPHIGFCTIGNCDHLSFFLLIESLLASCKFHPLFFSKRGAFQLRFHLLFFSILAPLSLPFFEDPSFAREIFHSLEFSRRITWYIGSKLGQGMIRV
jgi:hypothetical protein